MKPIIIIQLTELDRNTVPEVTRAQLNELEEKLEDFLWDDGFASRVESISIKSPLGIAIRRLKD